MVYKTNLKQFGRIHRRMRHVLVIYQLLLAFIPINHSLSAILIPRTESDEQGNHYIFNRVLTDMAVLLILTSSFSVFMSLKRVEL